ncbi:MAG: cupredoxin domain-containing protein [Alphaproteobacteria bacterium]
MKIGTLMAATMAVLLAAGAGAAVAADPTVDLVIKDHRFSPDRIEVQSGTKVILSIHNQDATAEEFESDELKREKVIPAGKTVKVTVGPLKPGEYPFKGEFHEDTARGVIVVK